MAGRAGRAIGGGLEEGVTTDFPGCLHSSLRHIVISGAVDGGGGMGLSSAAEGRLDGRMDGEARLSWRGQPTAERVAQIDLGKVGVGRITAPSLKRRGYKTASGIMVCHKTSTTATQLT